jgi:hypothetical protein
MVEYTSSINNDPLVELVGVKGEDLKQRGIEAKFISHEPRREEKRTEYSVKRFVMA